MSTHLAHLADDLTGAEHALADILAARNTSLDPDRFADVLASTRHFGAVRTLSPRRVGQFGWFLTAPGLRVLDIRPRWFENVEDAVRRGARVSALIESRKIRSALEARLGANAPVERITGDELVSYGHRWDVVLLDGSPDRLELMRLLRLAGRALAPGGRLLWAVAADDSLNTRAGITFDRPEGSIEGGDGLGGVRMTLADVTHALERAGLRRTHVLHGMPDAVLPEVLFQSAGAPSPRLLARSRYYAPGRDTAAPHPEEVLAKARMYGTEGELSNGFVLVARADEDDAMGRVVPDRIVLSTDRPADDAFFTTIYDTEAVKTAAFPQGKAALVRMVENHEALRARGITVLDTTLHGDAVHMPALGTPTLLQQFAETPVGSLKRSWVMSVLDTIASAIMRISVAGRPGGEAPVIGDLTMPTLPGNIAWDPCAVLPQGFSDLTVENSAVHRGHLTFFDQKRRGLPVAAGFVLYRSLIRIAAANPELARALPPEELAVRYGLVANWSAYGDQDAKLDAAGAARRKADPIARWSDVPR